MANIPPPAKVLSKKGAPPPMENTVGNLEKSEPNQETPLNFKVAAAFHQEFKIYAASHGFTMKELLETGYRLTKEKYGE